MNEPEIGTPHTEAHGVSGGLEPHDHLHGHGEGQHSHEGWTPDRVQARMRRDGFCAAKEGASYCMVRVCTQHADVAAPLTIDGQHAMEDLIERLEKADRELDQMASAAHHADQSDRLRRKAEGVRLALSYAREYL